MQKNNKLKFSVFLIYFFIFLFDYDHSTKFLANLLLKFKFGTESTIAILSLFSWAVSFWFAALVLNSENKLLKSFSWVLLFFTYNYFVTVNSVFWHFTSKNPYDVKAFASAFLVIFYAQPWVFVKLYIYLSTLFLLSLIISPLGLKFSRFSIIAFLASIAVSASLYGASLDATLELFRKFLQIFFKIILG